MGGCTYWFTSALVVSELILLLLFTLRVRNIWCYLVISILFAALGRYLSIEKVVLLPDCSSAFPWMYKHGFISMIYMVFGGLYWKYENSINRFFTGWFGAIALLIYLIVTLFAFDRLECTTSLCSINIAGVLISALGSILLISLCLIIPSNKFLSFIGNNSIGFYFLSGGIPMVFSLIANKLIPFNNTITMVVVLLLSLLIAYIAVYILNRWFPYLFDARLLRGK